MSPRPNRGRTLGSERSLSQRIAWEREKRGMTYDGLASRMGGAGCQIQGSALYKIEKGDPPRRITVDELVALAKVFGLGVDELLRPVEAVLHKEVETVALEQERAYESFYAAMHGVVDSERRWQELRHRAAASGDQQLLDTLRRWEEAKDREQQESWHEPTEDDLRLTEERRQDPYFMVAHRTYYKAGHWIREMVREDLEREKGSKD